MKYTDNPAGKKLVEDIKALCYAYSEETGKAITVHAWHRWPLNLGVIHYDVLVEEEECDN